MNQALARLSAILVLAVQVAPAVADEWARPTPQQVFSPNGEFFVRMVPGHTSRSASDQGGPLAGRPATAQFYARNQEDSSYRLAADVPLKNAIQPAYAKVTNDGYLVTFDDWGSIGRNIVISFYDPQGRHTRSIDIGELYRPEELNALPKSVTMTAWRCNIFDSAADDGRAILFVTGNAGAAFLLDPKAGRFRRASGGSACGIPVTTF